MEEQQSEGHPVSDNEEEPVQPTNADVTVTKSPRKRKRTAKRKNIAQPKEKQTVDLSGDQQNAEKTAEEQQTEEPSTRRSPRIRSGVQSTAQTTQRSGKRKRPEQPETHTTTEPTPLPKFIDDETRERFEWISQKGFITQWTIIPYEFRKLDLEPVVNLKGKSHTDLISRVNSVNIELNPDIVNSDKGKAPATEEETEEEDDNDEDEDTEEEDPAQFRLARRRSGSSKITF
nr:transcription initiation factor TFIID subunit 11-like [Coffea arabica]